MRTPRKKPQKMLLAARQDLDKEQQTGGHRTITFSNRDFDVFLAAIESEDAPNEALKRAAERYQQRRGDQENARK